MGWSNHVLWAYSQNSTNPLTPFTNGVAKNPITINSLYSNSIAGMLTVNLLLNGTTSGLLYTNRTRATGLLLTNNLSADIYSTAFTVKLYPNEIVAITNLSGASIIQSEFDP
jgi:hypothetical protein